MTATARVEIKFTLSDLGNRVEADFAYNTKIPPNAYNQQRRQLAVADTAEALDLGDISTSELLVITAVSDFIDVDLDFDSTFDSDFTIPEGETAIIPRPAGTIYIKNSTVTQRPRYEYYLMGLT